MKLYKTDAVVLRTRDFSETDKIVTLYTKSRGKVQAIAKGSRKVNSRTRGAVQPFTYGNFMLYKGRSLDTITQCEPIESFAHLREDLIKLAYSTYITELVEGFTVEDEPNDQVFLLLLTVLYLLVKDDPGLLVSTFEIRLLKILGYSPQLDQCTQCCMPVKNTNQLWFSSSMGGLLCERCRQFDGSAQKVQLGTVHTLKQLSKWDIRRLQVIKVSEETKKEMDILLRNYIDERIEKKLKSRSFLDTVLQ